MKKFGICLLVGLLCIGLVACNSGGSSSEAKKSTDERGGSKLEKLQKEGTVTIGFANEIPYAYEKDGELKGEAVDIAKAVFAKLGIKNVEGKLADFAQLIPGLQANQFDVITAGMAITPERCENVLFGEPEYKIGVGLVVSSGNPLKLESYQDIVDDSDAKIAVMAGAIENKYLKESGVSGKQIMNVPDIPAAFSAVQTGRANAVTGTEMTLREALESAKSDNIEFVENFVQPKVEGNPSYGAAAFNLADDDLRDAYNEKLAELKKDGTVAKILNSYGFNSDSNTVKIEETTTEKICKRQS